MLGDEALQQLAEDWADAVIASLQTPEEFNYKFSEPFEEKMGCFSEQRKSAT
jgi:hypothetical protein